MSKMYDLTIFVFIVLLSIANMKIYENPEVGPTLHSQLETATRDAECCKKNMRCCHKHLPPPNIEIRAVLARCIVPPDQHLLKRKIDKMMYKPNECNVKSFQGFDEDEQLVQSQVTKCDKKLILTLKMKNEGRTNTNNQFIVVDHVYDPISSQTVRILNPYVIKIKQDHVSQTYALKFLDFVNSEAREQVYNKHDGNYTGCCMNLKSSTCGVVKYKGKVIPYSQGFCCSCDAQKNAERQPETLNDEPDPVVGLSDPAYLMDSVQCPRTNINEKSTNNKDSRRNSFNETSKMFARQNDISNIPKVRAKQRIGKTISDTEDEEVDFRDKFKTNFEAGNNYKIQSMNDQYEDQLALKDPLINTPAIKKLSPEAQYRKKITHKMKTKEPPQRIMKMSNKNERNIAKPSVHKLLAGNKSPKPNFYDYSMQRIANDAFKAAINNNLKSTKNVSPVDDDAEYDQIYVSKRQVQSSGVQRRGGQNCADRYTPPHLNAETYHESTHCLRFSAVWYGVYKLDKPVIEQEILIQIFEKYETETGITRWKDITNFKKVKLGTFAPFYQDELPTIAFTYNSQSDDEDICLDYKNIRLLIPEGIKEKDMHKYPETRGGPGEYLVLPTEKIALSGDQCDVAGVGFEAFYRQPNRCSRPRGTCLHHQPKHMWLHDKKMEHLSKKGCYFLKYFGKLAKEPIRRNASSDTKYLTLNYYGKHVSTVDMEINADFNAVMRPQSIAIITEVYIDSTNPERTNLIVKVTNGALLSSRFRVRLTDCPLDVSGNFNNVQSNLVLISPQNQHIFKLTFCGNLDFDIFHCSIEAVNVDSELVALRRIRIQKFDRCICTWHCLCACIGSSQGLKCLPMKLEHYHAAGFRGGLPIISYVEHITFMDDVMNLIIYIFCFIFFTLLVLGLTKGLIGLCCVPVGIWGLNILLDLPKPMTKYYEPQLQGRNVIYDESGWPINPDTKEKVRNLPKPAEFCANLLFFFTYPTIVLLLLCKRLCCPFYSYEKPKAKNATPRKKWFNRKCSVKSCMHKESQANDADNENKGKGRNLHNLLSQDDPKKKPTIKVSIKEHPKTKPGSPKTTTPPKKSSGELSDNRYTSTDDGSSYTSSEVEPKK